MTKTFKLGGIFLITVVNLQIVRMIFYFIPLSDNLTGWLFSLIFQGLAMGLIPFLLYKAWVGNGKDYLKDFKLSQKINPLSYLLAVGIGFLVFYINIGASTVWYILLRSLGFTYPSNVGTIYSSPEVLVFELLATAVLPAIFEELIDRGLLLAVLENEKNDKKVVLIIGIMFGFLHQNIAQFGPAVFGGIVMAYMAVKCRNIVPGMIVHFMNNAILTILNYSTQVNNGLGRLYEAFQRFYSSNFLLTFATWAAAIWLIIVALRAFDVMNRKYRQKSDPLYEAEKPPRPVYTGEHATPPFRENTAGRAAFQDDYFFKIYGAPRGAKPAEATSPSPFKDTYTAAKKAAAVKWWEYGLLYCSILSAAVVTLFTFIWGLLR